MVQKALKLRLGYFVLLGAVGIFFGHANPVAHMPVLVLLLPFALFCISREACSAGQAFLAAMGCGALGLGAGLYWLAIPMHTTGGIPYVMAAPLILLLASYLGMYYGLACLGMRRLWVSPRFAGRELLAVVVGGLAFGGAEVLCSMVLSGFPWLPLAAAFAPWTDWVQGANLIGAFGLSAVFATGAGFFALALQNIPHRFICIVCGVGVLALAPLYGQYRLHAMPAEQGEAVHVGLVQGNIDQNQKWDAAFQQSTVEQYIRLSEALLSENGPRPTMLVWPETAMPFYFDRDRPYANQLRDFAFRHKVYVTFGTLAVNTKETRKLRIYNRMMMLDTWGKNLGMYDKQHLVPFGEYIPFDISIPFLDPILQGMVFTPGVATSPVELPLGVWQKAPPHSFGGLICYEVIFSYLAQERVQAGANILLSISNDAWFGRSSAPTQHLYLAVLRSIEQARPLLRATNTGISAHIDHVGRIQFASPLFEAGAYRTTVYPQQGKTVYHLLFPGTDMLMVLVLTLLLGYSLRQSMASTAAKQENNN